MCVYIYIYLGNGIIYEVMNGAVKLPFPPLASWSSLGKI